MYVVSKSQPIINERKIYFGADNRTFWALNQSDGEVAWKFKVGSRTKFKSIFSNPVLYKNTVIFGSYDGNIYALDRDTGNKVWTFAEADWVGFSPSLAAELDLVFIGLEFGLLRKRGGIVALNAQTGRKVWGDYTHPALTHYSPLYITERRQVVIGSNDGKARLYEAKTGKKLWEFTTFGGADYDINSGHGFSQGDIKESFAYDAERDYIVFGCADGFLYILNRKNGHLVYHHKCEFGVYTTPVIHNNQVYFSSTDKKLRCIDLRNLSLVFEVSVDGTRIFSSPVVIKGCLYIGTNAGRLHEINPKTGESLGHYQTRERITNSLVYNPKTNRYFLPTYANEIISLEPVTDADA